MRNPPPAPDRAVLIKAALGSVVFIAVGVAALLCGQPPLLMVAVAWVAIGFGGVGLVGVGMRLSGKTLGPSAETIGRKRAERAAKTVRPVSVAVHHKRPLPELLPARQADVRRVVRIMAAHGLFVPEVPDPALLYAGIAERAESVKPDVVLDALGEVDYYHPGADWLRWTGNLLLHQSKGEQDEAVQIGELAALIGSLLTVGDVVVRHGAAADFERTRPVDVAMTVDGDTVALSWAGDVKYLSTHIHHLLAVRLRDGGSGKRLAWLWTDEGAWISVLADGAVEALNDALKLGPRARCPWSWVDAEPPMAAGELSGASVG